MNAARSDDVLAPKNLQDDLRGSPEQQLGPPLAPPPASADTFKINRLASTASMEAAEQRAAASNQHVYLHPQRSDYSLGGLALKPSLDCTGMSGTDSVEEMRWDFPSVDSSDLLHAEAVAAYSGGLRPPLKPSSSADSTTTDPHVADPQQQQRRSGSGVALELTELSSDDDDALYQQSSRQATKRSVDSLTSKFFGGKSSKSHTTAAAQREGAKEKNDVKEQQQHREELHKSEQKEQLIKPFVSESAPSPDAVGSAQSPDTPSASTPPVTGSAEEASEGRTSLLQEKRRSMHGKNLAEVVHSTASTQLLSASKRKQSMRRRNSSPFTDEKLKLLPAAKPPTPPVLSPEELKKRQELLMRQDAAVSYEDNSSVPSRVTVVLRHDAATDTEDLQEADKSALLARCQTAEARVQQLEAEVNELRAALKSQRLINASSADSDIEEFDLSPLRRDDSLFRINLNASAMFLKLPSPQSAIQHNRSLSPTIAAAAATAALESNGRKLSPNRTRRTSRGDTNEYSPSSLPKEQLSMMSNGMDQSPESRVHSTERDAFSPSSSSKDRQPIDNPPISCAAICGLLESLEYCVMEAAAVDSVSLQDQYRALFTTGSITSVGGVASQLLTLFQLYCCSTGAAVADGVEDQVTLQQLKSCLRRLGLNDVRSRRQAADVELMLRRFNGRCFSLYGFCFLVTHAAFHFCENKSGRKKSHCSLTEVIAVIASAAGRVLQQQQEDSRKAMIAHPIDMDVILTEPQIDLISHLLQRDRRSLRAIFETYQPLRSQHCNRLTSSSRDTAANTVYFDGVIQFARDFEIVPQFVSRTQLLLLFNSVLGGSRDSSTGNLSKPSSNLSFYQFLDFLVLIATRCPAFAAAREPQDRLLDMMRVMNGSTGPSRISQRNRNSKFTLFNLSPPAAISTSSSGEKDIGTHISPSKQSIYELGGIEETRTSVAEYNKRRYRFREPEREVSRSNDCDGGGGSIVEEVMQTLDALRWLLSPEELHLVGGDASRAQHMPHGSGPVAETALSIAPQRKDFAALRMKAIRV